MKTIDGLLQEIKELEEELEKAKLILTAQLPMGSCGLRLASGFWECDELADLRTKLTAAEERADDQQEDKEARQAIAETRRIKLEMALARAKAAEVKAALADEAYRGQDYLASFSLSRAEMESARDWLARYDALTITVSSEEAQG